MVVYFPPCRFIYVFVVGVRNSVKSVVDVDAQQKCQGSYQLGLMLRQDELISFATSAKFSTLFLSCKCHMVSVSLVGKKRNDFEKTKANN